MADWSPVLDWGSLKVQYLGVTLSLPPVLRFLQRSSFGQIVTKGAFSRADANWSVPISWWAISLQFQWGHTSVFSKCSTQGHSFSFQLHNWSFNNLAYRGACVTRDTRKLTAPIRDPAKCWQRKPISRVFPSSAGFDESLVGLSEASGGSRQLPSQPQKHTERAFLNATRETAAARTSATSVQVSPDSQVTWRLSELSACLSTQPAKSSLGSQGTFVSWESDPSWPELL